IDVLKKLRVGIVKIPSGEITNLPYLRKVGALRRKIILSTGMATLGEVLKSLKVLVSSGTKKRDITVLQCHTAYPTDDSDANLRAMSAIRDTCKVGVGYSDHTVGIDIALAAAALGARVIEKHVTLDRKMPGPDHRASLDPAELKKLVEGVRRIEKALGSPVKRPSRIELRNRRAVRKSIVAAKDIKKNELFSKDNITVKRPAGGMGPERWDEIIGKSACKDFRKNEMIRL
ncbi:MAG: N-acetylneuraminate synthase family protein, partial [Candidatus Omnitrophota bacterium]